MYKIYILNIYALKICFKSCFLDIINVVMVHYFIQGVEKKAS